MKDEELAQLLKYIEEFRADIGHRLDEAARERADIAAAVAELDGDIRGYHQEFTVLAYQFDKLKEAILQIAQETGVKLSVKL